MINISNKYNCCGCGACVNICPKQCISFKEDTEGFLYPNVNVEDCINCNLCNKVCPYNYIPTKRIPITIYAAKHKDDSIRLKSSSGGIFTSMAEKVVNQNGIVFGAQFDKNWNVIHSYTDNISGLSKYRGSKYVQSNTLFTFQEVKSFLEKDKLVLYSGTPCQILGLKKFLRKEYSNLITVDFVCHGVPSPKVWQLYINSVALNSTITDVNFRNKEKGWRNYTLYIKTNNAELKYRMRDNQSPYMKGFLNELYLRPSCHNCVAKSFASGSDITIADYWWIHNIKPEIDDDKGISLVYINSIKGRVFFDNLNVERLETNNVKDINEAYLFQGAVSKCAIANRNRSNFFSLMNDSNVFSIIDDLIKPTLSKRLKHSIKKVLGKSSIINKIYKKHIKPLINK